MIGRTKLVATLEYNSTGDDDDWCVSPSSPIPAQPAPAPPSCGPSRPAIVGGQPYRLRVGVSATTNGFFARAIGLGDHTSGGCLRPAGAAVPGITTCARATVTVAAGGPKYALFTSATACSGPPDGVTFNSGSGNTVTGPVHTNSYIDRGGSSGGVLGQTGPGVYALSAGCLDGLRGSPYGNAPSTAEMVSTRQSPLSYTVTDFPCDWYWGGATSKLGPGPWYANTIPTGTFNWDQAGVAPEAGSWWVGNPWERKLNSGVYCANGDLTFGISSTRGPAGGQTSAVVTFVAYSTTPTSGRVNLTGHSAGSNFKSYRNNVLIAAFGNGTGESGAAALVEGSNMMLEGVIYAPNGEARLNEGSSGTRLAGALVAKYIGLTGSHLVVDGTVLGAGGGGGGSTVTLTQ
jgi:hypothetical protein